MFAVRLATTLRPFVSLAPRMATTMAGQKRGFNGGKKHFKKNKKQKKADPSTINDGSNESVLMADVRQMLARTNLNMQKEGEQEEEVEQDEADKALPELFTEIELQITQLSSTADGLAEKDGRVYVVPFTAPGDTVRARIYRHDDHSPHSLADFIRVLEPSVHRTETPKCPYFTECSGCQFQHLSYDYQLQHKRQVVEKAYANFSNLPASAVPEIGNTIGSPLQYGYRTKLTPHFDGPPGGRRDKRQGKKVTWGEVPPIGFMKKGTRKTIDIEDCPIGTDAVRKGMKRERERVKGEIDKYQRGATLLLRESTERVEKTSDASQADGRDDNAIIEDMTTHLHRKTCITDSKVTSTEYINSYRFDNPAGSFFQNNNSILPLVTSYIRDHILPPTSPKPTNLVDAYSGSGLFTITLSPLFTTSIGIDVSAQSITSATQNARLNNLAEKSTRFIAADATALFDSLDKTTYPPDETVVVLDPPRKGCDESFIRQLIAFKPRRICYVSCNVHTQARDVGWLVGGLKGEGGLYEIESLRGFDFFPQTGHVEGVAMLRRKGEGEEMVAESAQVEESNEV